MRAFTLLSLCLALALLRATYANENVFVFGDSLSDNGNLYAITKGTYPPEPYGNAYDKSGEVVSKFPGRFTDGQNWVDYFPTIANHFPSVTPYWKDGGTNFAVGGSTSTDLLESDPAGFPPQISTYLNAVGGQASADDLYVIWIGANDFSAGIDPAQTVANIKNGIATLSDKGARAFVVISLPDISLTPQVKALGGVLAAKRFVFTTNVLLEVELLRFAFVHRISIDLVDIDAIFLPLVYNPGRFGFTNSMDAAFNLMTGAIASDPNDYVFWDGFHPTTNAHYIAAKFIFNVIFSRLHFHEFLSVR